uniref:Putative trilaris n=1 Tax=Rhipicephalus pulchellus TaxID=72859 RepID=L7LQD8_RHIPC
MKVLLGSCVLLLLWVTYADHGTTPHRCLKPPAPGICRPFYKVFYFNYTEYKCRKLKNGLCIGGNNHFPSQMSCQNACIRVEGRKPKRCLETAQTCNCTADVRSWFFDHKRGYCRMYNHTKCADGINRFETEEDCMKICLHTAKPKPVCSVEPRMSWWLCVLRKKHWYFDAQTNTCHQSESKKCGNGDNRFSTFEKCMERCSYVGCQKCKNGVPYYYPNGTTPCGAEPE